MIEGIQEMVNTVQMRIDLTNIVTLLIDLQLIFILSLLIRAIIHQYATILHTRGSIMNTILPSQEKSVSMVQLSSNIQSGREPSRYTMRL